MASASAHLCISSAACVRDAIACIDRNAKGIVLVTDAEQRLIGTLTDGDIRRAMLAGLNLDEPVDALLRRKATSTPALPVTAPVGTARDVLLRLMQERRIRQIPLLSERGTVEELVTLDELLPEQMLPLQAVIMAGGFGSRLRPLTDSLPKPMLPVGDTPLMQHTIEQLRNAGIRRVNVTTHFMSEKIQDYFGDGRRFGVELNYVAEDRPLGTAGFLSLMEAPQEPLLVINGDILTQIDFRALVHFHRDQRADLTVGVRQYDLSVPYGVIEAEGSVVRNIVEKPALRFLVNAGIYLLEPTVRQFIPAAEHFDMTDLIHSLLNATRSVGCFPIREYWLDIGKPADYQQAQEDVKKWRKAS